jgi:hypothetical protein
VAAPGTAGSGVRRKDDETLSGARSAFFGPFDPDDWRGRCGRRAIPELGQAPLLPGLPLVCVQKRVPAGTAHPLAIVQPVRLEPPPESGVFEIVVSGLDGALWGW